MKEITREDWQNNPTPRMMWVWDEFECQKEKRLVVYCLSNKHAEYKFIAEDSNGTTASYWKHCAEITEEPKRMTNYELAKWLSEGASCGEFREWKHKDGCMVHSEFSYTVEMENEPCYDSILIRSNGGEWHEPLVEVEE